MTTQNAQRRSRATSTSTTLYDALLRVRADPDPDPAGRAVVTDTFYDTRGWLCKTNNDWWDSTDQPRAPRSIVTVARQPGP